MLVTRSTIARWLRMCLCEAGIDTGIFIAHLKSAASLVAAGSGITTMAIFQAADWSSEGNFERFYHCPAQDKSLFAKAVLSSTEASNLHVDFDSAKCNFWMAQGIQCLHAIKNYICT